jgi:flagellar biosynthetic protein FlhB
MADFAEKSQQPTPRRRQRARDEGHVAHSAELTSAALLLSGLLLIMLFGYPLVDFLARLMSDCLGGKLELATDSQSIARLFHNTAWQLGAGLLPIFGLSIVVVALVSLVQTGFLFMPSRATPDFSRVSPGSGLSRMFSPPSLVRLALGIVKVGIVAGVAYATLSARRNEIIAAAGFELPQAARFLWELGISTCLKAGLAVAALAVVDYGYQRWRHERDLMMTPQEVREEMRNLQANPQVVARRRELRRKGLGVRG